MCSSLSTLLDGCWNSSGAADVMRSTIARTWPDAASSKPMFSPILFETVRANSAGVLAFTGSVNWRRNRLEWNRLAPSY